MPLWLELSICKVTAASSGGIPGQASACADALVQADQRPAAPKGVQTRCTLLLQSPSAQLL